MRNNLYLLASLILLGIVVPSKAMITPQEQSLFEAARRGDSVQVNDLLTQSISANVTNQYNEIPLHLAVYGQQAGHAASAIALIDAGSHVNHKQKTGTTPLHFAAMNGNSTVVEKLITAGAHLNPKENLSGYTPLALAAAYNRLTVVDLLIKAGADINITDDHGRTPLYIATSQNHNQIVERLLCCAKVNCQSANKVGKTPLFAAYQNNNQPLKVLLHRYESQSKENFDSNENINIE